MSNSNYIENKNRILKKYRVRTGKSNIPNTTISKKHKEKTPEPPLDERLGVNPKNNNITSSYFNKKVTETLGLDPNPQSGLVKVKNVNKPHPKLPTYEITKNTSDWLAAFIDGENLNTVKANTTPGKASITSTYVNKKPNPQLGTGRKKKPKKSRKTRRRRRRKSKRRRIRSRRRRCKHRSRRHKN